MEIRLKFLISFRDFPCPCSDVCLLAISLHAFMLIVAVAQASNPVISIDIRGLKFNLGNFI